MSSKKDTEKKDNGKKEQLQDLYNSNKFRVIVIVLASLLLIALLVITTGRISKNKNELSSEDAIPVENTALSDSLNIRINEYVISNNNTFRDDKFNSPDWIELYNYGDEPVWLGDMYLSDDMANPDKFKLPDINVMPDEYVIVLASGNTEAEDEYIRAPFQLGQADKNILLSTEKDTLDIIKIEYLPTDISKGYATDGQLGYFAEPTPGSQNNTQIYDEYTDLIPINSYLGLIQINEYLPSNTYNITDSWGEHVDWIELYNPNETTVFLGDLYLSDDENSLNKYKLPDIDLKAHEYVIVYASGRTSSAQDEIHATFKISSDDSNIMLSHKYGQPVDKLEIFSLPSDVSAGLDSNGNIGFFSVPTPGSANITPASKSMDISPSYEMPSPLVINEWMSNNQFGILDANGDASDWIEIFNTSNEQISLGGYALSDSMDDFLKWTFPDDVVIEPLGYILVYASQKGAVIDGQLHTNFSLGDDETLYLVSNDAGIIDSAKMEYLPGNVSKGRVENGYGYFALPTPGTKNTTAYTIEIEQNIKFLHTDLYISEVASSKIHLSRYAGRSMYEYIELYNGSDETIDLAGYTLMESEQSQYTFGDVSIRAGRYLLVAVRGYVPESIDAVQASNLKLNSAGERILIKNKEGITIDCFDTGYLLGDYSSGRIIGDANTRVFFMEKTPGKKNSSTVYASYSAKPVFSHEGGMKDETFFLTITADSDATIYYTIGGGIPDTTSIVYSEPIQVFRNTVIRAIAVSHGKLPSLGMCRTFIFEKKHDIPVLCISSPRAGLFYDNGGIYANGPGHGIGIYPFFESNYFRNLERLASFEYYLEDGQIAVAFDGGIQIAGGYSRAYEQKSLAIRLRDEYGLKEIEFPFFDEGTSTFRHLLLRNGGQDAWQTKIRDAFAQNCSQILGTVDAKRARPVAVYINGVYWGLYNMRDKLNADYFTIKYGYDDSVVINIISEYSHVKNGSGDDWEDLKSFCFSNDFSIEENYYKLAERVDVESFIDYVIIETFFGNADTHNISFWKPEIPDGKWRPILFDVDLSIYDLHYSMVEDYLSGFLGYDDHILDALKESDIFKNQLLDRYSYILSNIYTEEYLLGEIDEYAGMMEDEMIYQVKRWGSPRSHDYWMESIEELKMLIIKRRNTVVNELADFYSLDNETVRSLFPWHEDY